jgi:hypothetical protein
MFLNEAVAAITAAMNELQVDPAIVEETHSALQSVLQTLRDDPFDYMGTIQRDSFGGIDPATDLSYHHGRAHQVMADVKRGIEKDIHAFAQNLLKAAEVITDVDTATATDLRKQQALAEAFSYLDQNSHADAAHDQSRNHVRDPWSSDGRTD